MDLKPYVIPILKTYKNGKQKLIGVKSIKWFDQPMNTILVTREGDHQPIKYEPFNPGSRNHIIKWMEEDYGYKFPYYTETGNVKADPESLDNMDHPAGKLLRRYLKVVKDQSQVGGKGGWLAHYNDNTHSIHHRVDLIGANTHRATHCVPVDYAIKTPNGPKHHTELQIGDYVYTYNIELGVEVLNKLKAINLYNTVTGQLTNGETSFRCTTNHKWVTTSGLKEASQVSQIDNLILKV